MDKSIKQLDNLVLLIFDAMDKCNARMSFLHEALEEVQKIRQEIHALQPAKQLGPDELAYLDRLLHGG